MNLALWIVAALFGSAFTVGGIVKMVLGRDRFAAMGASAAWASEFPVATFKVIGVIEALGGLGMILPGALDIAPALVPIAASGMALYMSGAATTRLRRGEYGALVGDLLFMAACLFVAWGRFGPEQWGW